MKQTTEGSQPAPSKLIIESQLSEEQSRIMNIPFNKFQSKSHFSVSRLLFLMILENSSLKKS